VSSTASNGDLGGVAGADARCGTLASDAELGPTDWYAWLSDKDGFQPADLTPQTIPYYLKDGTKVADDWSDLTDGTLDHAINMDEQGTTISDDFVWVWTNTNDDGTRTIDTDNQTCLGYTSGSASNGGRIGQATSTDSQWTERGQDNCSVVQHRIYCFARGPD
jgi:hypothetical protein